MSSSSSLPSPLLLLLLLTSAALVSAQEAPCYWAAGGAYRIPESAGVVPCDNNGYSTCCKLGSICLEGNACFDPLTQDTYQYGCSDPTYRDASCPYKCGWNPDLSPWVGLEYVGGTYNGLTNTWVCQSPESCLCEWYSTYELLYLPPVPVSAMGSLARVAIYASTYANQLPAYASLPSTSGGSTGYYASTGSTPAASYTPTSPGPTGTLKVATTPVYYSQDAVAASRTYAPATLANGSLPPYPITPTTASPSRNVLHPTTTYGSHSSSSSGQSFSASKSSSAGSGGGGSNNNNNNNSGNNGSGGLSTGAKVGLGVGIAGGVCLIAAIVLAAFVVRKRRRRRVEEATVYNDKTNGDAAAYYDPYNRGANVHEASYTPHDEATARKRMSPNGFIAELDSGQPVYELASNHAGSTAHSPALGASS